ncbi:sigma-54-dependent transcriptional regulator FlbD [Govanella unica]|uniref:Sigma-54 dependent transcriptional regulator n=1 Tax=Govanella unica TaxID=2975056 RepID=A0A9X3TW29_9PROT|nr:sigma-54 dependent transcriptional regulator [Govania unica]MDA5193011.1 sigma-54 dependent transcriptional regulator [Govania unica]
MRLIIVGTLNGQLSQASRIAMDKGARVVHAGEAETALNVLRDQGGDLVMIDVGLDVKSFIDQIRSERMAVPVIACGIGSDSRLAVAAIRAGAKEYLPLPPDAELIAAVLEAVTDDSHQFIYRDPIMLNVVRLADQVAPSEASIMITGESGTGKEVMARYVHRRSRRSGGPFISVNCAAIPENLLESELFGHEKGAFTGAVARRIGKFEEANGGTLLLDEISEMDVRLQAKLLRAIQEREIDRVGGGKPVKVDLRIVATSNRDLAEEVRKGTFREDLLFRLNVVNLRIPSLRDRPEDIRTLSGHFIDKYAEVNRVPRRPLSLDALNQLLRHSWTGNVRELENTMHRAVLLATGDDIGPEAILLPDGQPHAASSFTSPASADATDGSQAAQTVAGQTMVGRTVAEVERHLIIDTLSHCFGNRTHAANILGISIRTLRNKLNQYVDEGVPVPLPGEGQKAMARD